MTESRMRFCINAPLDAPILDTIKWWKACDDAGLHVFGIPDSPVRRQELYAASTLCALNTSNMGILTCATNPITRHPSVTASGLLTLDELAPGRIAMGIATGDSSIWGVGLKPASVSSLREYIVAVQGLIQGEEVSYRGNNFRLEWDGLSQGKKIPVYVACSGPKVLKMASQVADGLIVTMGFSDQDIQNVRDIVKEGCAEVGRNPNDLHIWWNAYVVFAPSVEEAMKESLGWSMSWIAMTTLAGKGVPDEYKESILKLTLDRHDIAAVYKTVNRHQILVERSKELGLYDWLISRSPRIFGTPDDVSNRLAEFEGKGLTDWMFYVSGPDHKKYDLLEKLTREVMPNFS
jgi:5,10-methylenetetrahydromethanopterin reductase